MMNPMELARVPRDASPVPSSSSSSTVSSIHSDTKEHRSWFFSRNEISQCSFTWTVENFNFYLGEVGPGRRFSSPAYTETLSSGEKHMWNMVLDPYYPKDGKIWVVIILETASSRKVVQAKIKYSLLGTSGETLHSEEYSKLNAFGPGLPTVWWKILRQDLINYPKLYPEDNLTIRCEIQICNNPVNCQTRPDYGQFAVPMNDITDNMKQLYESRLFSDVVIRIGRRRFKAHKAILASASEVFAAMFEHEMKEKLENTVTIKDIEADVFEEVLRFVYTGEAHNYTKFGLDLLAAADKYGLDRLKVICERAIAARVNEENVAHILFMADFHNSPQLRRYAIDYINSNPEKVISTEGWKTLLEQGLHLLPHIYLDLVQKTAITFKKQRIN